MKYMWTFKCIKECVEGCVSYDVCQEIDVYFQFILIVAFIVDVGRVIFSRGMYKIKGFFIYNDLIDLFNKVLYGKMTRILYLFLIVQLDLVTQNC